MFIKDDLIEDLCTDEAGQLMTAMHKIETWTKARHIGKHFFRSRI